MIVRIANESEKNEANCCVCNNKEVEFNATDNGNEYLYCAKCARYMRDIIADRNRSSKV